MDQTIYVKGGTVNKSNINLFRDGQMIWRLVMTMRFQMAETADKYIPIVCQLCEQKNQLI